MGRTVMRPALAAGLMGLAAALKLVSMLTGTTPSTTLNWVTLALLTAAALSLIVNAAKARRSDRARDENPSR